MMTTKNRKVLNSFGLRSCLLLASILVLTTSGAQSIKGPGNPSLAIENSVSQVGVAETTSLAVQSNSSPVTMSLTSPGLSIDSLALVELYDSTNGNQWTNHANWKTGPISTWFGVTLKNGRVIRVVFPTNNLVGRIPKSIGNLQALSWLQLFSNHISGSIPSTIGNLTFLSSLLLQYNNLTGPIPSSVGNLTQLQYFYVYDNHLSGDIPATMGNLSSILIVAIHNNNLTGNLEWIGSLKTIQQLFYYSNPNLNCALPNSIGNLTNMTVLAGGAWSTPVHFHSKVHGPIPASLGNCTKLTAIYLDNSEHTGQVPATLSNLKSLQVLSLWNNPDLAGNLNEVTAGITTLTQIFVDNTAIGGTVPASAISTKLLRLWLSDSKVTTIPPTLTTATNLTELGLDSLYLTQIPNWATNFSKLVTLYVGNNKLSAIPNFSAHPNKAKLTIRVFNNNLDFGDLEPLFTAPGTHPFASLAYAPQADIGLPQKLYFAEGTANSLSVTTAGAQNIYQWQKQDNSHQWMDITGATAAQINFSNVLASDSGYYRLKIANQKVTGLTLYSSPFHVEALGGTLPPLVSDVTICAGQVAALTAQGTGTVNWYDVGQNGSPLASGGSFTTPILTSTKIFFVSQTINGIESIRRPVTITVNPVPTVNVVGTQAICIGKSAAISVSGNAIQYVWSNSLGNGLSVIVTPTVTTTYTVIGTGSNGCQASGQVTVSLNPLPTISITPTTAQICEGGAINIQASGGLSYRWSTGQTVNLINVRPAATTTYTVTATNVNGCENSASRIVTVDTTCPASPEDLRGVALSTSQILVTWTNVAPGVTGFNLERSTGGPFSTLATLGAAVLSYTDENLLPGTVYSYRISSLRNAASSLPSAEVSVKTFSIDQHFVKTTSVLKDGIHDENVVATLPVGDRIHSWNYLDGEMKVVQSIVQEFSPLGRDVVQPSNFDALGRQTTQFLPYTISSSNPGAFRPKPTSEQSKFYNGTTTPAAVAVESINPYLEVSFENSPISRPEKEGMPGSAWRLQGGATSNALFGSNEANEVLIWRIVGSGLIADEYYNAGALQKTTTEDEQHEKNVVYVDKYGRTILTKSSLGTGWIFSYSVYDEAGNLRCVVTPKAVANVMAQPGMPKQLDQGIIASLCYQSEYDRRGRIVMSKSPGVDPEYFVYDKWNNLVLSQNGQQRLINQWTCIKRDTHERAVLTGLITDLRTAADIQSSLEGATVQLESRTDVPGNFHGYTNQAFPSAIDTVLSVLYFDDYSFVANQISDPHFSYKNDALPGLPGKPLTRAAGMSLGAKIRVLGTDDFLWSVLYYDNDARLIQSVGVNHQGGIERVSSTYNFANWKTGSRHVHFENDNNKEKTVTRRFEFDDVGRLLRTFHKIDDLPEVQLHEMHYNELGQLIKKEVGVHSGTALQVIDYRYNIQGKPISINGTDPEPGEPEDFFSEELAFEIQTDAGNAPRLDGLITSMRWKDNLGDRESVYNYSYDGLKRLTDSHYKSKSDVSGWTKDLDVYTEDNISYDFNGNIQTLDRYSKADVVEGDEPGGALAEKTDELQYHYDANSNILKYVDDLSTSSNTEDAFKDGNHASDDYEYSSNGNLRKDLNKGIVSVKYNFLNLPTKILFANGSYFTYSYGSDGTKLNETYVDVPNDVVKAKDYFGEFYYVDGALSVVYHEDGQYSPALGYRYFIQDHVGSPRVWFRDGVSVSHESKATLETSHAVEESSQFIYYEEAVKVNSEFFDHTREGGTFYSTRLNGTQNERTGLAKSLSVMPGDTVRMQVFAKYLDPDNTNWNEALRTLMLAIAGNSAAAGTVVDGGAAGSTGGVADPYAGLITKDDQSTGPKAYLNYLVFDRDFRLRDGGYLKMSELAREDGSYVKHDSIFQQLVIKEAGYVYMYLSNESDAPVEVYFDDFTVEHIEGAVDQVNGYYPYGASAYTWIREGENFTNGLFQGKDFNSQTGWHDFDARQYDPTLGRWFAIDPEAQFSSPYLAMGNSPVLGVDRNGKFWHIVIGAAIGGAINLGVKIYQGKVHNFKDGAVAFGIGALAGGIGAATGGAVFTAAGGAASGAGGFLAGFFGGAAGNAFASPIQGIGNSIYFHDPYEPSLEQFNADLLIGGLTGGLLNGVSASIAGRNFFTGGFGRVSFYPSAPGGGTPALTENQLVDDPQVTLTAASNEGAPNSSIPNKVSNVVESAVEDLPTAPYKPRLDLSDSQRARIVNQVNGKLNLYPKVVDPRTGTEIPLPAADGSVTPQAQRVHWGKVERAEFIKQWYDKGYGDLPGGWSEYDIHHILPREFGGTNDFWNLVPVLRSTHQQEFNAFWAQYGGL